MSPSNRQTTAQVFELAVSPTPSSVSVCRLFVGSVARHYEIDEDTIGDLKVAVSEAVTNSIKAHVEAGRVDVPVRIRVLCDAQACFVEIHDEGNGFEPPPQTEGAITPPSGLYEGSLGLLLIRSLFPEAEIASGEAGTTVRFAAKR